MSAWQYCPPIHKSDSVLYSLIGIRDDLGRENIKGLSYPIILVHVECGFPNRSTRFLKMKSTIICWRMPKYGCNGQSGFGIPEIVDE